MPDQSASSQLRQTRMPLSRLRLLVITTFLAGGIGYGSSQGSGSGFDPMDNSSGILLPMELSTYPRLPTATPSTAELQPSIFMTAFLGTRASSSPQPMTSLQPTNVAIPLERTSVIPLEPTSISQLTAMSPQPTISTQSTHEFQTTTSTDAAFPLQPTSITPQLTSSIVTSQQPTDTIPQPTRSTLSAILPTTTVVPPEATPTSPRPTFASSVSSLPMSSSPIPSPTPSFAPPTNPPDTTESPRSFINVLEEALGGTFGVVGAAVAVALVAILLVIVCCICCCCMYKTMRKVRRRKKPRLHLDNTPGISFENQGARNGVLGTSYQYKGENSLQELHHYDMIGEADGGAYLFNESALDTDLEFPVQDRGEASQMMPSQLSLANTEIFQKGTLPELSPMTYSLTANYPIPGEDASGLYINTLPTSTLSLKQPTPFGLSLQNEESKSNQGSRLSIHGSRPSIHGSRPSIHGSRPSIHGSRPSVHESRPSIYSSRTSSIPGGLGLGLGSRPTLHNSGTSESALLLGRFDKDDEPNTIFSNRLSSPNLLPSNSDTIEVPTRDSSPLPHLLASSHPLGHTKRDFASLTCIVNPNTSPPATPTPEPLEEQQDNSLLARTRSPTHKKPKMDLTSLTSVPIPEEDENLKVKKEESPATKKGRSKTMSRLEKLTSLDYIRQSFRIKKKKVSFQNVKTPESTPTPSKKTSLKKQTTPPPTSNGKTSNSKTSNGGSAQPINSPAKDSPQRRISTTSSDLFSPTEDSYLRMQQQLAAQGYVDHMMPMPHYAQLSQPNYYFPQYPYPQLSQQYYPQLSQGYPGPYASPYHHMHANPYMGLRPGEPGHRDPPINRYKEVITPDFSDITSPDHERYRGEQTPSPEHNPLHSRDVSSPDHEHYRETSPHPSDVQGSEYSYDLRPHSPESYDGDEAPQGRQRERQEQLNRGNSHHPPSTPGKQGEHHLGMHPQVSPAHYAPYFNQDTSRYGLGYGRGVEQEGHYPPQPGRRSSGAGFIDGQVGRRISGGSIPEREQGWRSNPHTPEKRLSKTSMDASTPFYHHHSISVDEPLQRTSPNHRHANTSTAERRHSTYSDTSTSERRHSTYSDTSMQFHAEPSSSNSMKHHVSWSSDVREHPANITNHNHS